MWLNKVIDAVLLPYQHLLRDSLHLVNQLRNERLPEGWAMIRIDLDHFFMSGTSIELADAVASLFELPLKTLVHQVCMFLLTHQYIASSLVPGLWRVVIESGMGLRHSSSICDAAFLALCELPWGLKPVVRAKYHIERYWRFRDDILILTPSGKSFPGWFYVLRERGKPVFSMQCVEYSRTAVTMLAVRIGRHARYPSCFSIRPRLVTHPGPMLSVQSGHPPHVHLSWPLSVLRTKLRLCTKDCLADAFSEFMKRLQMFHCPCWMIERLSEAFHEFKCKPLRQPIRQVGTRSNLWMVLPWHPGFLGSGIVGGVARLSEDPVLRFAFGDAFQRSVDFHFRISWRNSLPKLVHSAQHVRI